MCTIKSKIAFADDVAKLEPFYIADGNVKWYIGTVKADISVS